MFFVSTINCVQLNVSVTRSVGTMCENQSTDSSRNTCRFYCFLTEVICDNSSSCLWTCHSSDLFHLGMRPLTVHLTWTFVSSWSEACKKTGRSCRGGLLGTGFVEWWVGSQQHCCHCDSKWSHAFCWHLTPTGKRPGSGRRNRFVNIKIIELLIAPNQAKPALSLLLYLPTSSGYEIWIVCSVVLSGRDQPRLVSVMKDGTIWTGCLVPDKGWNEVRRL